MIASVVVTLEQDLALQTQFLEQVSTSPELEVGEYSLPSHNIPLTIDVRTRCQMEDLTTWLRDQPVVSMVDVVFVHFEEADEPQPSHSP